MQARQNSRIPFLNFKRLWAGGLSVLCLAALTGTAAAADGWVSVADPKDMADTSGDIRSIGVLVKGDKLYLSMTVEGVAAPSTAQTPTDMSNRYYYHWLLDTDNNPATGRSNAEYENNPTGVKKPIGAERVVMIGWRDGKPNGIELYDPANEDVALATNFTYQVSGNTVSAVIPFSVLGVAAGQTIAVSAFQEGASDGWAVDWIESDTITLTGLPITQATVSDPKDMADTSGDIRSISAHVEGNNLLLAMSVEGVSAPSTEQTPTDMSNRYYYHWLLDTDNNPATGRSNAEYENNPTGVKKPIGAERVIMIGWRDGKPNGIELYDPANEDVALATNFTYSVGGNTLRAVIPLSVLGVSAGQTIALSAFQEGASDGWAVDWMESETLTLTGPAVASAAVADPKDMADTSGDVRGISVRVEAVNLLLSMTVEGVAAPSAEQTPTDMSNRYYYHWLLDTDNNPATGRSNAEYENNPTGVKKPIGAERVIMIGWRDGKPNGVEVYDPANEDVALATNFTFQASGNTLTAVVPLSTLGLSLGQTIAVSAFQEGASDGWAVDWLESEVVTLEAPSAGRMKIDGVFTDWTAAADAGFVTSVDDVKDMADTSGDIRRIQATVEGGYLYLRMAVDGIALPSTDQTPEGMVNRYYYHWLLDTDNNPATGRSNAEYENNPTGVKKPIGSERVVMLGWRDGAPNGLEVYDPANEDVAIVKDFEYGAGGDSVEVRVKMSDIGLSPGQTIAMSAFQEGASDGWAVDWMESAVLTLTEGGSTQMTVENLFSGNAYGYTITLIDSANNVVETNSIVVRVNGQPAQPAPAIASAAGTTTVTGVYPALMPAGSTNTVSLALRASDKPQARDYVYTVEPYTVLPLAGSFGQINTSKPGFVARVSQISTTQSGVPSVHSNIAEYAELQLFGRLTNEATGQPFVNEASSVQDKWALEPVDITGPVNWYEFAPDHQTLLNFTNDTPFPKLTPPAFGEGSLDGVALDLLTYVELPAGWHKLGVYTEGGHIVYSGLTNNGPVLSRFDNSTAEVVPTYFARSQFFNVVAPQAGYYPMRFVYFQARKSQEPGLMLEIFSEKDRVLRLLNNPTDPLALKVYRAGALVGDGGSGMVTTPVTIRKQNGKLVIEYTGMLQRAEALGGTIVWQDYADATQSPVTIDATGTAAYYRSRSY